LILLLILVVRTSGRLEDRLSNDV